MDVRQCKRCGKLYNYVRSFVCPACDEEVEKDFITVKEYIYQNPRANLAEIAENTGVDNKILLGFLREGRIALKTCSEYFTCSKCGKPINTGTFCNQCKNDLNSKFNNSLNQLREKEKKVDLQNRFSKGNMYTDPKGNL